MLTTHGVRPRLREQWQGQRWGPYRVAARRSKGGLETEHACRGSRERWVKHPDAGEGRGDIFAINELRPYAIRRDRVGSIDLALAPVTL
jgi:hypothetical protein